MSLSAVLTVCRLLHFGTCIFVFGASTFCLALPRDTDASDACGRLRVPIRYAAFGALLTSLLWLLCVAGSMMGNWQPVLEPQLIGAVLSQTEFGTAWSWHVGLSIIVLLLTLGTDPARQVGTAVASALLLASIALTGHATMDPGALRFVHEEIDAAHLLAVGFWLGGLATLPALLTATAAQPGETLSVLRRFSELGVAAVVVALATGIGNALFIVRDWPRLLGSAYGEVLTVKVALVVALIGFACFNRFYLMPRLESQPRYSDWLRRSVWSELALGGLILIAASALGTLAPPMSLPPAM